jgi:hypothetical protein
VAGSALKVLSPALQYASVWQVSLQWALSSAASDCLVQYLPEIMEASACLGGRELNARCLGRALASPAGMSALCSIMQSAGRDGRGCQLVSWVAGIHEALLLSGTQHVS